MTANYEFVQTVKSVCEAIKSLGASLFLIIKLQFNYSAHTSPKGPLPGVIAPAETPENVVNFTIIIYKRKHYRS